MKYILSGNSINGCNFLNEHNIIDCYAGIVHASHTHAS